MADHRTTDDISATKNEYAKAGIEADNISERPLKDKFKEIVKEGSGLTFLKVLVTALTAVSMSLLSANLTGVINSLILVALVSVGTAIVSEFYRILLSVTSLGAKKVVAPVIQVKTMKEGNTVRTITEEVVVLDESLNNEELDSEVEELEEFNNEKAEKGNRIHQLEQEVVDTGKGRSKLVVAKIHQRFVEYFKKNPFMKFIALFSGIAILTIGTSYFVSENNQNTDNIFTTVYKTEETQSTLSDEEKQEIIDEAVKQARENAPERTIVEKETEVQVIEGEEDKQKNNTNNNTSDNNSSTSAGSSNSAPERTNGDSSDTTSSSVASDSSVKDLEDRIKQLEEDNETLRKELTTLRNGQNTSSSKENSSNSTTVEELEEQIRIMQEQIDALSGSNTSGPSTIQPSTSTSSTQQGTTTE